MKGMLTITCFLFLQQQTLLHTAPPIESCPYDSVQVEDICKCNPDACSKPPCPYELNIAVNGTENPGSCCSIYSCDGCPKDNLIFDKCPCAPGAVLDSKGHCKCVNPHESLINNECVCDKKLCELPQICTGNYVSVTIEDGCCSKTKCIRCPDDSFVTNNNDDAVEDKCVCYPCTNKECGLNEKVVIIQRGNGFPGSCCDMYKCEKNTTEEKCVVGDITHDWGESWESPDGRICTCEAGISFCTKTEENLHECHKEGSIYKHDESWMIDSCTNCTCLNGEIKCIAHMCEVLPPDVFKNLPCSPFNCSKECPDGYKVKRGCPICKCNYPYKYGDILQKYNITKNKLEDILDDYFAHNNSQDSTTTSTSLEVSDAANVSDDFPFTTTVSELDSCQPLNAYQWSAVGISICVALLGVIFVMRWLSHRKKGSYDTNPARSTIYERMNLTKDVLTRDHSCNNNYIRSDCKENKNASTVGYN